MTIGRSTTDLNSARLASGEERFKAIEFTESARPAHSVGPALEDALDGASLLDTQLPSSRPKRQRKDCCVCCGMR